MIQIVYVANFKSQQIYVWKLNNKGKLELIQIVNVPGKVQPLFIEPNKRYLYAGIRPRFSLITYQISQNDGSLELIEEFLLPGSPTHISTDHTGRFLFVSSYNAGCVNIIQLKNGIPIKNISIIKEIESCHSANISPDNCILWVLSLKKDCIYLFNFKKGGKLTKRDSKKIKSTKGSGPRHMVFHPKSHQYSYVINELNSSINVWKFDYSSISIKCIQTIDIMPPDFIESFRWASDIHITPNGHYVYACDRTTSIITVLSTLKNGKLLKIEGFQKTEMQPRSFCIDNFGKFLISAGQESHHISVYKIKEKKRGFLEKIGRYDVGKEPVWILINPIYHK